VTRAVQRARLRGPRQPIDLVTEPWYAPGSPAALERAVVNLLDNAVKFSPPDAGIDVQLSAAGTGNERHGELTVRDHGPGIPAEDRPFVFERFWRSPAARGLPGTGLGLAIVAQAVGEAGGTVALEPASGGGTLARVWLPGRPDAARNGLGRAHGTAPAAYRRPVSLSHPELPLRLLMEVSPALHSAFTAACDARFP
jgi:two-component system sensor histidine kinase MprB